MANDADIQLDEMLESYPSSMTPGFQTLITAKKEFAELASDVREKLPPGRGTAFKHQEFYARFVRDYSKLVILDEPGTGKTCSTLRFPEYSRSELEKAKTNPGSADEKAAHFKRVIILVKGPTQKNEIRNQLVCKCSDGRYETGIVQRAKLERVQKGNISLELKRAGYIISTYGTFSNKINKEFYNKYPEEEANARIQEAYSDTIFWIDEAHNLLIDSVKKKKITEKQRTYVTLWKVLHLALRSKVFISTATPMINHEKEIGSLMNLVLPLNGELPRDYDFRNAPPNDVRVFFPNLPFDISTATYDQVVPYFVGQFPPDYDFTTATLTDLEPYFRGKVGFIRAADTGALPEEQGILQTGEYEINGAVYQSQLVLYATEMSDFQSEAYVISRNAGQGNDELRREERQASNFVFPDGQWGNGMTVEERKAKKAVRDAKKAIKDAIEARGQNPDDVPVIPLDLPEGGIIPMGVGPVEPATTAQPANDNYEKRAFRRYVNVKGDSYAPTQEFEPWLQSLEYIRTLSCKYAEVIRLIMSDVGNAFVYSEYVEGSGSIVLALCFEGMGFERYNESTSLFTGIIGDDLKPYCSTGTDPILQSTVRRPRLASMKDGARPRYVLLTRATSESKFHSMMEAMNSYENRHGDFIKVFITSRVGRDGINVNNVRQIHLIGPEWNQSVMFQALFRGLRATSHEDLIREERERIIRENTGEDPDAVKIPVKIFKHAAVANVDPINSIDLHMYRFSESKDRGTKRIMRILKQCAIGCQIHYVRNVRPGDVDGTPTCDYDVCNYECVDPPPVEIDYSTYDVLYATNVVNEAVNSIINIYRQRNALTLDDIAAYLPNIRRKYIIMALEKLIVTKTPLTDRFGYTTYLREDKGSFYLDRAYPTSIPPEYAMSYYTQGIIAIKQEALVDIVVRYESGEYQETIQRLETVDPASAEFDKVLKDLSIEGQVYILEDAILRSVKGEKTPYVEGVIEKYNRMIFPMKEQVTEINRLTAKVNETKPKRGRKPNPNNKRKAKKINPIDIDVTKVVKDTQGDDMLFHILYTQVKNQTAYANTAKYNKAEGRIRLLKPSEIEQGWRDLNDIENTVYNAFIQLDIAERNRPFEQHNVYGFILPDGEFRIRNKMTEKACAKQDARCINRGLRCITAGKPALFDIMYEIGIPEPAGTFPLMNETHRGFIINTLILKKLNKPAEELATWSLEKLIWYYKWMDMHKVTRNMMCNMIKEHMKRTGLLVE